MSIDQAIASLLSRDTFVIQRQQGGTDEEGFPKQTWVTVASGVRGTWGSASTSDIETGQRMGETVTAVCAGRFDAKVGDKLKGLRGQDWIVVHARPLVTHQRYFLREVD